MITQGSLEGGNIGSSVKGGIVPLLEEKKVLGWQYVEIPGVSHNYVPYNALYEGLRAAFPDFAVPRGELVEGLVTIKEHYRELSTSYGHTLDVPNSVYAALVRAWFNSRDPEEIQKRSYRSLRNGRQRIPIRLLPGSFMVGCIS